MPHTWISRRDCLLWAVGATALSGCGTILFPERRGQSAGMLDWKIVALDGIGLLFFFVPGVIAFAVDFNNGTIYLPPSECTSVVPPPQQRRLLSRMVPRGELSVSKVNQIVAAHLQHPFELTPGEYQTRELASVEEFWTAHEELVARANL
jgi:hypothetical protein